MRAARRMLERSALQEPSICRAGPDSSGRRKQLLRLPMLGLVDRVWFKDMQVIFLYSSADRKKNQSTHK